MITTRDAALEMTKRWFPEDDPIVREQIDVLLSLLGGSVTEAAFEGFLIVCWRFVDEFGGHRTEDLRAIFRTDDEAGRRALLASLEHMNAWVGGVTALQTRYPVSIKPPKPAFPQFRIVGIETIAPVLYRVLDTQRLLVSGETVGDYVRRRQRLPLLPRRRHPVRRSKGRMHWCSYEKWASPDETRDALQIRDEWSDCGLRATIATRNVKSSAYVPFSGVASTGLEFTGYFLEPTTKDNEPYAGGGLQVALDGAPLVDCLERWDEEIRQWVVSWRRHPARGPQRTSSATGGSERARAAAGG